MVGLKFACEQRLFVNGEAHFKGDGEICENWNFPQQICKNRNFPTTSSCFGVCSAEIFDGCWFFALETLNWHGLSTLWAAFEYFAAVCNLYWDLFRTKYFYLL